jgi:Tfp pilus assembly protein PilF
MNHKQRSIGIIIVVSFIITSFIPAFASKTSDALDKALSAEASKQYNIAFDAIVESLVAKIKNEDALSKFPSICKEAYEFETKKIAQTESSANRDELVAIYDRISMMNSSLEKVVNMVKEKYYSKSKNKIAEITDKIIALKPMDITGKRDTAAKEAASTHYERGLQLAQQESFRQSKNEFSTSLHFVPSFKDAAQLETKYKALADEKDASVRYDSAMAFVDGKEYRKASEQFLKAVSFKSDFKDAKALAEKYKIQADQDEAKTRYESAVQFMQKNNFKDAYDELQKVNTLVPGFQETQKLIKECMDKLPPDAGAVQAAISACLKAGVPVSWVGNLMGGSNASLSKIEVVKVGIYNERFLYWPMKIRVVGSCTLNDPFNPGKTVSFDKVGEFKLTRNDYGEWQAELSEGMFQ